MNKNNLINLGISIKRERKSKNMRLSEVADIAGVSKSLLSKIENFRTIPSLPVLIKITNALKINIGELFSELEETKEPDYIITRRDEMEVVKREKSKGFLYQSLILKSRKDFFFESFIVTLEKGSERKTVSTNGDEFLFILEGSIDLILGNDRISLCGGDSIYFNGRIPHVPKNTSEGKTRFLIIYLVE